MGRKLLILALSGMVITGGTFLLLKKKFAPRRATFRLSPALTPLVDLLRGKNFFEFPVEIPEDEFEVCGG